MKKILLGVIIAGSILLPKASWAHSEVLTVRIFDSQTYAEISSFAIPTANLAGGASLTAADLGADGAPEIIVGMGLGNEPRVHVYRQDGSEIGSFLAYAADMGTGITVEVCDINNDGLNEIITGTQYGGGPHVRLFNNLGEAIGPGFFAYGQNFRGGVNLACGDIDNDGINELVTGAGPSGGPHARVWFFSDGEWKMKDEFFVFDSGHDSGIIPFIKDSGALVVVSEKSETINFVIYDQRLKQKKLSTISENKNPIADIDELDGKIIFSLFDKNIINENGEQNFFLENQNNGSKIAVVDLNNDDQEEIISIEARPMFGPEGEQYITIDLSEQRLYAYENKNLANTFLVSSAKYPWTTKTGIHSVLAKIPVVDYTWSYGEDNVNNYSLGPTPWNLLIYQHHYIHYAWWHNNFGHPMSHGCVNVSLTNIKWLYEWAKVGTVVEVRE